MTKSHNGGSMTITKAPGLNGTIFLEHPVTVLHVTGAEAYEEDGMVFGNCENGVKLVTYYRLFDDGSAKSFKCKEYVADAPINLSKAPWTNVRGRYVVNVGIEVTDA